MFADGRSVFPISRIDADRVAPDGAVPIGSARRKHTLTPEAVARLAAPVKGLRVGGAVAQPA